MKPKQAPRKLPRIVRLIIVHWLIGFVLAAVFTALLIVLNVANIGYLVNTVQGGWFAGFILFMLNGIVFAGVQSGIAIMGLKADD